MNKFYVYEHWRPDVDLCFYVGKGHGNRAGNLRRNNHHHNIVAKLSRFGMCVEVRMVQSGLTEREAFDLEIDRIAFWRSRGVRITNLTDGGDGPAGAIVTEATRAKLRNKRSQRVFTEADRAAMSAGRIGMEFSEEHRANLAARKIGKPRKPFSEETLTKMRAASALREAAKREKFGSEVRRTSKLKESV